MRVVVLIAGCALLRAQSAGPAHEALTRAYDALRARDYPVAIESFQRGIEADPKDVAARKDLGYTYLKVGERELAREELGAALALDSADTHLALEYAYLCNE